MFIQYNDEIVLPLADDIFSTATEENELNWEIGSFEIDGTGKLHIVNTGGTVASEGGMGTGSSQGGARKGELQVSSDGTEPNEPNTDNDNNWDPIKDDIDEATAARNKNDKDE